jgi:hypothetical protein
VSNEEQLRQELMAVDIVVRRKQTTWETPRNIALLSAAIAAVLTGLVGVAGFVGFRFGQAPQTITVHFDAPLIIGPKP